MMNLLLLLPVFVLVKSGLAVFYFCKLDGGGVASGGLRELIPCIARTSVAVGVDGIFMEVKRCGHEQLDGILT